MKPGKRTPKCPHANAGPWDGGIWKCYRCGHLLHRWPEGWVTWTEAEERLRAEGWKPR